MYNICMIDSKKIVIIDKSYLPSFIHLLQYIVTGSIVKNLCFWLWKVVVYATS